MSIEPLNLSTRSGTLIFSILLLLVFSLFAAANTQACHKGVPHKKDPPDACSQSEPIVPDNNVLWGDDSPSPGIFELNSRLCQVSQVATDESSGTYTCEMHSNPEYEDHILYGIEIMASEPVHRRGDDWRCTGLSNALMDPDLGYSFSWSGDCTTGCDVSIVNAFTNPWAQGNSVARLTLEAFANITTLAANPFNEPRTFEIDYLHLTMFGQKGNNKVLAVCELTPNINNPVTFVTSPVE